MGNPEENSVMNTRPRTIRKILFSVLDTSEYSGTIPEIHLAVAWGFISRQIWGWEWVNYA